MGFGQAGIAWAGIWHPSSFSSRTVPTSPNPGMQLKKQEKKVQIIFLIGEFEIPKAF